MIKTVEYYNKNWEQYKNTTQQVDFSNIQKIFLQSIPYKGLILDFGCGAGRDTKAFLEKGYSVEAIDASKKMCEIASEYTGIDVHQMRFDELNVKGKYDGIWACASLLHVPKIDLKDIIIKMRDALKTNGCMYMSFKYGDFEGERNDRYFSYYTEDSLLSIISTIEGLTVTKCWQTNDVREDRGEEGWINLIIAKN